MSLETFGWILVLLGLVLFIYGLLKASARIDVLDVPRVTQQEKREALAFAAGVRILARPSLYDWQENGEL